MVITKISAEKLRTLLRFEGYKKLAVAGSHRAESTGIFIPRTAFRMVVLSDLAK